MSLPTHLLRQLVYSLLVQSARYAHHQSSSLALWYPEIAQDWDREYQDIIHACDYLFKTSRFRVWAVDDAQFESWCAIHSARLNHYAQMINFDPEEVVNVELYYRIDERIRRRAHEDLAPEVSPGTPGTPGLLHEYAASQ